MRAVPRDGLDLGVDPFARTDQLMSVQARRPTRSGLSGSLNDISSDRFDPLLLAEGEYWFRDHSCNVWSPQKRR